MDGCLWVAELMISPGVASKITTRHGVMAGEIQDAVVCQRRMPYWLDVCPDRGERFIVKPRIRSVEWLVVLYPSPKDPDRYALGTAYPVPGGGA